MASAQIPPLIRPDLEPPGAQPAAEGETPWLSPSEERRLLRQLLWQPEKEWDLATERAMERILGRGRVRRLDEARFQLHLAADDWDLRSLTDDADTYERTKDTVLSSYVKIQREILEEAFQIEQRLDAWVDRVTRRDSRDDLRFRRGRSYDVRLSPRLSFGSDDSLGLKLRMPYADHIFLDHLSLRVRHHFEDGRSSFAIQFDADDVFFNLEYDPDCRQPGDQLGDQPGDKLSDQLGDQLSLTLKIWL